jgi:hypothetical protein
LARGPGLGPSAKLGGLHPVNTLGDHDLGMLAIADLAAEDSRAAFPAHRLANTQVGLILPGGDPARSLLRWLAFRGSPPGNRCLPDMSYNRAFCSRKSLICASLLCGCAGSA